MTTIDHLGYLTSDALRLVPERPALLQDDTVVSHAELDERADRVAGWLLARGARPGWRVALLWYNDLRYVEQFLGIMRAGAVAVPLNTRQSDEVLAYVLADSGCAGVLTGPALVERGQSLVALADLHGAFVAGPDEPAQGEPLGRVLPYDPDDVCMQPYTSGSTGRPKGVPLTHRGQVWNIVTNARCHFYDEGDRALLAAPLYHKNAATEMKAMLFVGGSSVILPEFDPVPYLQAVERHRVTLLSGVPTMYRRLLNEIGPTVGFDLSSVRLASAGSAPVTVDLLEDLHKVCPVPILEGYGLTEGGPIVLSTPLWGTKKLGSLGIPFPGTGVQLRDSTGAAEVAVGEVGELWVKNPGVTPGYHGLPEVTAERIRDGWLATRDLMRRDADGYFYFVGRTDDMINVSGENVYPKEVEQVLLRHPGVKDVAVVPAPHPEKGTVPVAYVVADPSAPFSTDELVAFFHQTGPHFAYPRAVELVDSLPLTGTSKVDRHALTERARKTFVEEEAP
jgi:acyl-CoA synthetase (AMP-forming)/AMP-acid ligase II